MVNYYITFSELLANFWNFNSSKIKALLILMMLILLFKLHITNDELQFIYK